MTFDPRGLYRDIPNLRQDLMEIRTKLNFVHIASDLVPARDDVYSLGTSVRRWKNLQVSTLSGATTFDGCVSFEATGGFRLPNRTAFPASLPCSGSGAVFYHTTNDAIYHQYASAGGPVLRVPGTTPQAPVPVGANDDGVNPPILAPLGTISTSPFGDLSDAILVLGAPAASDPTVANSSLSLDPKRDSSTTAPTITARRNATIPGATFSGLIVDFAADGGAGTTRTLYVTSSGGFFADITADHVVNAAVAFHAGPLTGNRFRFTYTAPSGPGTISTDAGDLALAPFTSIVEVSGSVNPAADNTHDLGTALRRWKNAWIVGTLTIGTLSASTVNTSNLNVTTLADISGTLQTNTLRSRAAGNDLTISGQGAGVVIVADTFHAGSNATNRVVLDSTATEGTIATAGNLFLSAVGGNILAVNTLMVGPSVAGFLGSWSAASGTLTTRNHVPQADNTYDLGASGTEWKTLYIQTSIVAPGAFTFDLVNAAATTLSVTNSNGGVAHLTVAGGISATGGAVSPSTAVIHGTDVRGGSGTVYVNLNTTLGVPAITTPSGGATLYIWPNYPGNGGLQVVSASGMGVTGLLTVNTGTLGATSITTSEYINALAYRRNTSLIITDSGITNNLDVDGGATGMKIRLLEKAGASANDREITVDFTGPRLYIRDTDGGTDYYVELLS